MVVNKGCPHCGSKLLKGWKAISCTLKVKQDKDTGNYVFDVVEEDNNTQPQYDVCMCTSCNSYIKRDALIDVVATCKKCGNQVAESYLNEEGVCYTCVATEDMPNIATLTKEDLILMLVKSKQNMILSEPENETPKEENEPVLKKRKIKRKADDTEHENAQEPSVTQEEV